MFSYSEIPTDIATPPAAVFPTAEDTNDPPTASSLPDILSLSRRVDSLSAEVDGRGFGVVVFYVGERARYEVRAPI